MSPSGISTVKKPVAQSVSVIAGWDTAGCRGSVGGRRGTVRRAVRRLTIGQVGNRIPVSANPDPGYSPNDGGGVGDTLRPTEALDSDDVRNDDGDETVDPPEGWREADKINADGEVDESLDEKLAAEEPEQPELNQPMSEPSGDTELRPDDQVERIDPDQHGRDMGQIDGTPEDGDSFFPVVE